MHTEQWRGGPVSQEAPKRTECKNLFLFFYSGPDSVPVSEGSIVDPCGEICEYLCK